MATLEPEEIESALGLVTEAEMIEVDPELDVILDE